MSVLLCRLVCLISSSGFGFVSSVLLFGLLLDVNGRPTR